MTSDKRDERNPYVIKDPGLDTGRILQVDEGWLLNPQCTAFITLLGSTCETAQAVKRVLEQSYDDQSDSVQQLALLIRTHGLSFRELRNTLEAYRMRCFAEFEKLKARRDEHGIVRLTPLERQADSEELARINAPSWRRCSR